jgi:hypothetical protein
VWFGDHNTPKRLTMAKVIKNVVGSVGLSYSLQSHRKQSQFSYRNSFQISQNTYTGEVKVKAKSISLLTNYEQTHDRYKRSGQLFQEGLTSEAKHKIQKAVRVLENVYKHEPKLKSYCSMITLTYGKDFPSDHDSKKHLDTFLKRLRRLHPNCKYIWVAEKQKRGAIHYHILTPYYTPKEWVNDSWNAIAQTWQSQNNLPIQPLLPNVIKVFKAGSYLAKYLQKEGQNIGGNGYGIDFKTRSLMKDESVYFVHHDLTQEQINDITNELIKDLSKDQEKHHTWKSKYSGYSGGWISGYNQFNFDEWLKYKRHDYDLMLEHEQLERRIEIQKELILKYGKNENNH